MSAALRPRPASTPAIIQTGTSSAIDEDFSLLSEAASREARTTRAMELINKLRRDIEQARNDTFSAESALRHILVEHKQKIDQIIRFALAGHDECRENLNGLIDFVNHSNEAHEGIFYSIRRSIQSLRSGFQSGEGGYSGSGVSWRILWQVCI